MRKTIYILTLLCLLAMSFAMFVGCEAQSSVSGPKLYVFTTEGCKPCLDEKQMVDAIRASGRVLVLTFGDESREFAKQMGVIDCPTYIVFVAGKEEWRGHSIVPVYRQMVGR